MWDVGVFRTVRSREMGRRLRRTAPTPETAPRPLLPQLAALGYRPENITYLALSHYHSDHVANANAFAGSTWLVHAAERDAMFVAQPEDESAYDRLRNSKTIILPNTDYDVFGDGTV